jgi:two-component system, sensor histidine kinase LadS
MRRRFTRAFVAAALLRFLAFLICFLPALTPDIASAFTSTSQGHSGTARISLEGRLAHFADASGTLPFEAIAQAEFVRDHFAILPEFRSLGYDTQAHWFHFQLSEKDGAPSRRVLVIGSPELEELDVWTERKDGGFNSFALGYNRPYSNRPLGTRLFALPVDTFPGMHVYFRVRTNNAINVHAELSQPNVFTGDETRGNFLQGLYFGILMIAVVLYAILGARLRDAVMAAYAGYIASQLLFHLGATGYLPVLLAGQSAWLMDGLPRIGWLGGAISIVLMWDQLLDLKRHRPLIHRLYLFTVALHLALLFFVVMPSLVTGATLLIVKLANYLTDLNFVIAMVLLIQVWRRSRRAQWLIYLLAFVIPALGTLINTATNQGILPWNGVTANFYQIAALVHVLVMSYGLALRLRQLQHDKAAAEQEATIVSRRAEEQRHFVAMLSHEFGNPLAAIDRAAQMVQINTPDMQPKDAQRLAQIRSNATTLSGFVDRFLMTEALDNGALALSRRLHHIRHLVEDTVRKQDDSARVRIDLRGCPAGMFEVDFTLIGVAIGNLLTNALRYSLPDSAVEIGATLDDAGLRIRVADHGPGLDADELEKLGAPYFRGTTSLGKKGSGLGYHFTRRIVEAHGGTLTARSEAGAGLEVEIFLPK